MSYLRLIGEEQGLAKSGQANWVFIHGWGSDNSLWLKLREQLLMGGILPVSHYTIDLPGFGGLALNKPETLQDYLAKLERTLPNNCILVGWSLGGMIATQLAARNPQKVKALITLASNPSFVVRSDWPWAMDVQIFENFLNGFQRHSQKTWMRFCGLQSKGCDNPKSILKELRLQVAPEGETEAAWMQCLQWLCEIDNRKVLTVLSVPSIHLFGEDDSLVPDTVVSAVESLGLTTAVLIKGGGHCLHLSRTQELAARIEQWLRGQNPVSFIDADQGIDKQKIARSFGASAATYDAAAQLQKDVATELLSFARNECPNANSLVSESTTILDLGCGTGYVSEVLSQQSISNIAMLDIAEPMVKFARGKTGCRGLVADAEYLPFKDDSLGAVVSSLAVQWCKNLSLVSKEVYRSLLADGYFIFSTLGPRTLFELKESWAQVNGFQHVNGFQSLQDVKSDVLQAGFTVEAIESSRKIVQYSELLPILKDLKSIGAHNMNAGQNPGLTPARQLKILVQEYEKYRDEQGMLPVTYDVIFVLAKKETGHE